MTLLQRNFTFSINKLVIQTYVSVAFEATFSTYPGQKKKMNFLFKLVGLLALVGLLVPSVQSSALSAKTPPKKDCHKNFKPRDVKIDRQAAREAHLKDKAPSSVRDDSPARKFMRIVSSLRGSTEEQVRPRIPSAKSAFTVLPRKSQLPPACVDEMQLPLLDIPKKEKTIGGSLGSSGSVGNIYSAADTDYFLESPKRTTAEEFDSDRGYSPYTSMISDLLAELNN